MSNVIDYRKRCRITWAITKNCNYNCDYCNSHNEENYLSKNDHDYVINFLLKISEYFNNILL